MQITSTEANLKDIEADALYLALVEGESLPEKVAQLDQELGGAIDNVFKLKEFKGKLYETAVIHTQGKIRSPRVILVGIGKREDYEVPRMTKNVSGVAARRAVKLGVKKLATLINLTEATDAVIQGIILGNFNPALYKSKKEEASIGELILVGADPKLVKKANLEAEAVNWVRSLIAEPANVMTPKKLVDEARKLARDLKLGLEVIDEREAARKKMGAFLAIAKGSDEPSYMLVLRYKSPKVTNTTLGIVGKGITFDTGGISIKPSQKMHEMKMDMAGAASMLGIMKLVGELKPSINVIGIAPITENMPGGRATRPGDVVKTMDGKTMEILNTDAEGRVVMSDAFTYVQKLGANKIYELSTLTGAVNVALGPEAAAVLGKDDVWIDLVIKSSEEAGERLWQLPIFAEHKELLKSDIADVANIPPIRQADVIAGAVFLGEFVQNGNHWAHIDIGATAYLEGEKPYLAKGPTGFGVATAVELINKLETN